MIDQRSTGTTNEQLEDIALQLNIQGFRGFLCVIRFQVYCQRDKSVVF